MGKQIIILIFLALGYSLYSNHKKTVKKYIEEKQGAWIKSREEADCKIKCGERSKNILGGFLLIYCLGNLVLNWSEQGLMLIIIVYLTLYYIMQYSTHEEWFFNALGLWGYGLVDVVRFENILAYEWREYRKKLILRVRYKGKGIMTLTSDFVVKEQQKQQVTEILNQYIAGI